jgi:segregation and condensation protein B
MTGMPTPKQILEAVLFASDVPVVLAVLVEVLGDKSPQEVRALIAEMAEEFERGERGIVLQEIAGGFQILSRKECSPWVERMLRSRRKIRLSKAALESLAIIAYRQPITKVEVDSIRGVDSAGVLHTLLERNLVTIKGRSKGVGRPLLYSTTQEFLSYMGINELADLPELKEVAPLLEERERLPEGAEEIAEVGVADVEPAKSEEEVTAADGAS